MDLSVGQILEGKVTGITKFGAFISVAPGKSGLVHISEIANTYVSDVRGHLTEGQDVKVKVIGIDENGRINLSIKKAEVAPPSPPSHPPAFSEDMKRTHTPAPRPVRGVPEAASFEDKLKQFIQDSDSKISGIKLYSDRKTSSRRGGGGRKG